MFFFVFKKKASVQSLAGGGYLILIEVISSFAMTNNVCDQYDSVVVLHSIHMIQYWILRNSNIGSVIGHITHRTEIANLWISCLCEVRDSCLWSSCLYFRIVESIFVGLMLLCLKFVEFMLLDPTSVQIIFAESKFTNLIIHGIHFHGKKLN